MSEYANPHALVTTEWLAANLDNPSLRIVESNEDPLLYGTGHIPGAINIDWVSDLNDPLTRDYLDAGRFSALLSARGIGPEHTVVFYGDKSNWWACYALWVFALFGHRNTRILNGGRLKWVTEKRPLTRELPRHAPTHYQARARDDRTLRAFRADVLAHLKAGGALVDVRSPQEFTGERLHMPDYPNEGALRGGHIPGARNIPWAQATREDGTFKSAPELRALYAARGITDDQDVVAYCRIGERSSHTWFVLSQLLGFPRVRNYDGSWTEWGNGVGLPIEKG
ncbi:MAG: sulfurtransferase [Thermoflexales bacterium]|nr:sulfurtransferase [Thermoflexales bacterium]